MQCIRRNLEKGWAEVTNYTASATTPNVFAKSVAYFKGDPGYLLTACKSIHQSCAEHTVTQCVLQI